MLTLNPTIKKKIDNLSYEEMLKIYRFSIPRHYMFKGDMAGYFCRLMQERKENMSAAEQAIADKKIGWDGDPIRD